MGVYDTYGNVQIKVGEVAVREYEIGDTVDIPDGVYIAPDGVVVIINSIFVATFQTLNSKWGDIIIPSEVVRWL